MPHRAEAFESVLDPEKALGCGILNLLKVVMTICEKNN
jgi:hypothetical protein